MRYSDTHKTETHAKLVKLAGRMLREKGPDKLAVAELMQGAGLTHGGFYAHFASKDVLLTEALKGIFADSAQKLQRMADGTSPREALSLFVDSMSQGPTATGLPPDARSSPSILTCRASRRSSAPPSMPAYGHLRGRLRAGWQRPGSTAAKRLPHRFSRRWPVPSRYLVAFPTSIFPMNYWWRRGKV